MMVNVLVASPFPSKLLDKIRMVSPEIQLEYHPLKRGEFPPLEVMKEAQVLYTWATLPTPDQAPNLRWIQFHSAGIDHVSDKPIVQSDVLITTTSGIHAVPMSEYVMAMILAWSHRIPRMIKLQEKQEWPSGRWTKFVPDELRGATLGLIGYGSIAREIARLADAFGMKVLATKRDPRQVIDTGYILPGTGDPEASIPERIYPSTAIKSVVSESDYVVLCLPLTEDTKYVVNSDVLGSMRPDAVLINVSRGGLVDQTALIEALRNDLIAGASLDVFEEEPLPVDSELWTLENVIISPHVAGFTPQYDERAVDLFATNLERYLDGRPLLNLVDRSIGY
ncbi:MAG: D-2-hydroxyacid dehydrogenase [Chloroflexota bacterium]